MKYAPRSVEFQKALSQDGAIRTEHEIQQLSTDIMDEPTQPFDVDAEIISEPQS